MTTPLRIGQIPFINCILFFTGLEKEPGVTLAPLVPRALSAAAASDAVDAGPVPLVDTWEIEERYQPLGSFCIATTERARSVFLFSKAPVRRARRRRDRYHRADVDFRTIAEGIVVECLERSPRALFIHPSRCQRCLPPDRR
jgi:hypothetical protein